MFALTPGALGQALGHLGESAPPPTAVLVISPHWPSRQLAVQTTPRPDTIHDFGGFPDALYRLHYPAPGHPALAEKTAALLEAAGYTVDRDANRGLDHGAWVPLMHVYPDANVPVFQLSLPVRLSTRDALQLGEVLRPLRDDGVLIIGSGSLTHNLYEVSPADSPPLPYVPEFAEWVSSALSHADTEALIHYRLQAPHASRAHPTEEHFLPLLIAMGAGLGDGPPQRISGGVEHGVLAMDAFVWGQTTQH